MRRHCALCEARRTEGTTQFNNTELNDKSFVICDQLGGGGSKIILTFLAKTYYFARFLDFCRKLHENERNGTLLVPPLMNKKSFQSRANRPLAQVNKFELVRRRELPPIDKFEMIWGEDPMWWGRGWARAEEWGVITDRQTRLKTLTLLLMQ